MQPERSPLFLAMLLYIRDVPARATDMLLDEQSINSV
jgi:hypothetical protein